MSMEASLAIVFVIGIIIGFIIGCVFTESRFK